jgi:hypothetical protein
VARLPENFPDLVEHWTLLPTESDLLAGKHDGPTKLAFALLLKFYSRYGRFPRGRAEVRDEVVLPANVLRDVAVKVVAEWKHAALIESPSHVRRRAAPVQVAMLAALLLARQQEITDALVQLLISTVHRIGLRAEKKVFRQMAAEFTRVSGKESLLLKVADAALRRPDETVRQVLFPLVGSENLRNLAAEFKAGRTVIQMKVQASYCESYTRHYRQGLIRLLGVLEFRCENSHQPVLDAVRLVRRYADDAQFTYYPEGEGVPQHKGLAGDWETLVYRTARGGSKRVVRAIYELRTLEALCDQLRCKGIWVQGAAKFRTR